MRFLIAERLPSLSGAQKACIGHPIGGEESFRESSEELFVEPRDLFLSKKGIARRPDPKAREFRNERFRLSLSLQFSVVDDGDSIYMRYHFFHIMGGHHKGVPFAMELNHVL
jgi:hypothetical protein